MIYGFSQLLTYYLLLGNVNSLDWNDELKQWNELFEWSTGLDYWSAMPKNQCIHILKLFEALGY